MASPSSSEDVSAGNDQDEGTTTVIADEQQPASAEQAPPKRRILMPVDASDHSQRAFHWYASNLYRDGDLLLLIHIVEPNAASSISHSKASSGAAVAGVTDDFNKLLTDQVSRAKKLGGDFHTLARHFGLRVTFTLHMGSKPGEHICRVARENAVDVLVIGNRGISALRRTILGSVSDYVVHHCHLPVVLVPPPSSSSTSTSTKKKSSTTVSQKEISSTND